MESVADGFFLLVLAWLKLIGRWMELKNPFASLVDSATSGRDALREE